MSTVTDLFAPAYLKDGEPLKPSKEILDVMAKDLGVDSVRFVPLDRVAESIGLPENELCLGCVNRKYPTPKGVELYQLAIKGDNSFREESCMGVSDNE